MFYVVCFDGVFFFEKWRGGDAAPVIVIVVTSTQKKIRQKKKIIRLCLSVANLRMILLWGDCARGLHNYSKVIPKRRARNS